jgi:hypothetical protein
MPLCLLKVGILGCVGFNTHVHRSNVKNLSVYLSLPQTSKNAMSFFLSLMLKTRRQNRLSRKQEGGWEGKGDPNDICTYEYDKTKKLKKKQVLTKMQWQVNEGCDLSTNGGRKN